MVRLDQHRSTRVPVSTATTHNNSNTHPTMPRGVLPGSGLPPFNMTSSGTPAIATPSLFNTSAFFVFLALLPCLLLLVRLGVEHGILVCCTLVGLVGMALHNYAADVPELEEEYFYSYEAILTDMKADGSCNTVKHEEVTRLMARSAKEDGGEWSRGERGTEWVGERRRLGEFERN
jgi:hypothetical protein